MRRLACVVALAVLAAPVAAHAGPDDPRLSPDEPRPSSPAAPGATAPAAPAATAPAAPASTAPEAPAATPPAPPTPAPPPPMLTPPSLTPPTLAPLQPSAPLQPGLLARARTRKRVGRVLTLAGAGAVVVALAVGIPLIWDGWHGGPLYMGHDAARANAGLGISIAFGVLGGGGVTAGSVLWQTGAADEAHLTQGDYAGPLRLAQRRRAGVALLAVGAVGLVIFAGGWGLIASKLCTENCSDSDHEGVRAGIGLVFGGIGLGATGLVTGGILVDEARRDRRLQLALRPGGLALVF